MGFFGVRFVCACVCVYVWMCVHVHVCVCVYMYTHTQFRKYTFQYQGLLNFADVSNFLEKIRILFFFFWKNNTFTQSNGLRAVQGLRGVSRKRLRMNWKIIFWIGFHEFLHYIKNHITCDVLFCIASLVKILYKLNLNWGSNLQKIT